MTEQQEFISILMMTSGVFLWCMGGYRWKGFRRYILPSVIGSLCFWYGLEWWRSVAVFGLLLSVSHLPYGDRTPWLIPRNRHGSKTLTAVSYVLPAVVVGWTLWLILTPAIFMATFWMSNNHRFAKDFTWKVAEAITGLTIVITIIAALQRPWGGG